jgi:hypothetical protein
MAQSTEKASAIREKLNELERIRSGADNIFETLATGGVGDLQKVAKELLSFQLVRAGQGNFNQPGFGRDAFAGARFAAQVQTPEQQVASRRQLNNAFAQQQGLNVQDPRLRLALEGNQQNALTRPLVDELDVANRRQADARDVLATQERDASRISRDSGVDQLRRTLEDGLKNMTKAIEDTFGAQNQDQDRQAAAGFGQSAERLAQALEKNPLPESIEFRGEIKPVQHNVVGGNQIAQTIVKEVRPLLETLINEKLRRQINFLDGSGRGVA